MDDLLQTTVNAEEGRRHSNANIDMKLEAIVIPVSDVDRAKEFYTRLGWRLDADHAGGYGFRLIQFTPPCSGSSIQFGVNLTPAAPGSSQGLLLAVSDIEGGSALNRSCPQCRSGTLRVIAHSFAGQRVGTTPLACAARIDSS
jgi:catechol 2,3-dioxygenase-like lactoylglutathione lyase family enzyme